MESELTTRGDCAGWIVKLVMAISRQLWLLQDSFSPSPQDIWEEEALLRNKWPGLLRKATLGMEELRRQEHE